MSDTESFFISGAVILIIFNVFYCMAGGLDFTALTLSGLTGLAIAGLAGIIVYGISVGAASVEVSLSPVSVRVIFVSTMLISIFFRVSFYGYGIGLGLFTNTLELFPISLMYGIPFIFVTFLGLGTLITGIMFAAGQHA